MSRPLVVLRSGSDAWILEWSSCCDAPASWGTPVAEAGDSERVCRALWNGTSFVDHTATGEEYTLFNRAGAGETILTREQMIDYYCRRTLSELPSGFNERAGLSDDEYDRITNEKLAAIRAANDALGYDQPPRLSPVLRTSSSQA